MEQWCKLRAQLLLAMAAPCAAALRASQVSAQPPVQHLFTLMHMLSHHRARRVLAGCYTMMARSCSRAAHYALRAAASPHSTRCTPARTAHASPAAGAAPDAALCSHLACSLDAVGPHDALRACCSAPACPACELIEQAHQPHCWGATSRKSLRAQCALCARAKRISAQNLPPPPPHVQKESPRKIFFLRV